jgi:hypothetical protein
MFAFWNRSQGHNVTHQTATEMCAVQFCNLILSSFYEVIQYN